MNGNGVCLVGGIGFLDSYNEKFQRVSHVLSAFETARLTDVPVAHTPLSIDGALVSRSWHPGRKRRARVRPPRSALHARRLSKTDPNGSSSSSSSSSSKGNNNDRPFGAAHRVLREAGCPPSLPPVQLPRPPPPAAPLPPPPPPLLMLLLPWDLPRRSRCAGCSSVLG